jgi:hypothetical protein
MPLLDLDRSREPIAPASAQGGRFLVEEDSPTLGRMADATTTATVLTR